MRNIKYALPLAALVTSTAYAQDYSRTDVVGRSFAGIMGGQIDYSEDGFSDLTFTAVAARVGHDFNRFFGLELRGGTTLGDEEFMGVDFSIPYFIAALTRFGWLPVDGNRFGVYGMAGYVHGELQGAFGDVEVSQTEGDISLGAGVEYDFTERHGVNVEYLRYFDKEIAGSDVELSSIGGGYVFRF